MMPVVVLIVAAGALWWHWRLAAATDDVERRLARLERARQEAIGE